MFYQKYQHIERYGTNEVQGIEQGTCYVFPKIDGTNGQLYWDDGLRAGSRNRELTLDYDNQGFYNWACTRGEFDQFFYDFHDYKLFGEWLCPHSLRTYRESAWRKFYVFDVMDSLGNYLTYDEYKPIMEAYGIDYIPAIAVINNGTYDQFIAQLKKNNYLIEDGKGIGEGIVIKNYDYFNPYGRKTWAKIVTSEFKEKHFKVMGASPLEGKKIIEEEIAEKYVTTALVEKEYAKIASDTGWTSKDIPRLLNTVYHSVITEDAWQMVKEFKNPVIDFKRLQHFVFSQVKLKAPVTIN